MPAEESTAAPPATAPAEASEASETSKAPANDQLDGGGVSNNGSALTEPKELKVEVKLADLQADPNNPLYSATSFEGLNLYVKLSGPTLYNSLTHSQVGGAAQRHSPDELPQTV